MSNKTNANSRLTCHSYNIKWQSVENTATGVSLLIYNRIGQDLSIHDADILSEINLANCDIQSEHSAAEDVITPVQPKEISFMAISCLDLPAYLENCLRPESKILIDQFEVSIPYNLFKDRITCVMSHTFMLNRSCNQASYFVSANNAYFIRNH